MAQEAPLPAPAPSPAPAPAVPEKPKPAPAGAPAATPPAKAKKGKRGPPPDTFRFLHFRELRPGNALDSIELWLEEGVARMEVRYLGQVHREVGPPDPATSAVLLKLLSESEVWPRWEGAPHGCIALGFGAATLEATLGPIPTGEAPMERAIAVLRLEALQLAYWGELRRYATDEPSLAAGTIDQLVRDLEARRVTLDRRLIAQLNTIALDRTVRPLVREGAARTLARNGIVPKAPPPPEEEPPPPPRRR